MRKKLLILILAGLLCALLAACGNTVPAESESALTEESNTTTLGSSAPETTALEITGVSDMLELTAPDGFSLTVSVNDPSLVQSYQWQYARAVIAEDDGTFIDYDWYDLNGSSAVTDTLICPNTSTMNEDGLYRCMITDTAGNVQYSDFTGYTLTNGQKTANYIEIGEIAVRAGETVDLADTAMGTGTISLNEAGDTAVMKDVVYCNSEPVYDNEMPSQGFCFCDFNTPIQVFTLEIQGDCRIDNVMFQEDHNSGGLAVLFNVWGSESQLETARITGDGTLTVKGGEALIYADCSLDIDCDLVFDSYDTHFTDGIRALGDVSLHDCSLTSEKLNGRIIFSSYGSASVSNCTIEADCNVPGVSAGAATYRGISGKTGLEIFNSDITFNVAIHGDWLPGGVGQIAGLYSEGVSVIDNSDVQMTFATDGESDMLYNLMGLYSLNGLNVTNSKVSCNADTPSVFNATGINTKNLTASDTDITLDINGRGAVYGVADTGRTSLTDARLTVAAANTGTTEDDRVFAMMVYDFGMEGSDSFLHITANRDTALGIYLGYGEKEVTYDDSYEPTGILAPYTIEIPANGVFNEYSLPGYDVYTYVETIYAAGSTENPVQEVLLKTK